ncbi:hypothetical protein [Moorena sp. SIO1F2]|nr:hypothetical protein [Moorena sp. SIO1F2]
MNCENFVPCSLLPTHYSLFPVPCSLFPVPFGIFKAKRLSKAKFS